MPTPEMGWEIPNNLARILYFKKELKKETLSISRDIFIDRNKKIINFFKKIKKKYDLVLIFNVMEHVYNTDNAINEIKKILKPGGKIIGATPFLYRIHHAPEDYNRYTKQFFEKFFKENNLNNIHINELGFGPFCTCYSITFDYLKLIPFLSNLILTICLLLDKFLSMFVKTSLKKIYPISYFFYCEL